MQISSKGRSVVASLARWYKSDGRTFPWRHPQGTFNRRLTPYRILISEIMLQQTQVSRVMEKYPEFLRRFPSMKSLARSRQRDVVLAWRGMGYNNRAVRLHQLALAVQGKHSGRMPSTFDELIALPGIGRYTANAMLSSAFGKPAAVVDVNVQRVLSRIFWKSKSYASMRAAKEIWDLAETLLPRRRAYDWNQALMDFGATICTARRPTCTHCPVARHCSSRGSLSLRVVEKRNVERGLNGIPNRIYRGRIIERLRDLPGIHSISFVRLGRSIFPKFGSHHHDWLNELISGLEKDGLVRLSGNGDARSRRVRLA